MENKLCSVSASALIPPTEEQNVRALACFFAGRKGGPDMLEEARLEEVARVARARGLGLEPMVN